MRKGVLRKARNLTAGPKPFQRRPAAHAGQAERSEPDAALDSSPPSVPQAVRLVAGAREAGWTMKRRHVAFLRELDRLLRFPGGANVAVLVREPVGPVAELVRATYPETHVNVCDIALGPSLHAALAAHGPFHVILDDTPRRAGHARLLRETFFHLAPGGSFLCRRSVSNASGNGNVREFVGRLTGSWEADLTPKRRSRDDARLAEAVEAVRLGPDHLLLTNRTAAWAKLRDQEVDPVLEKSAGRLGRVLERRPAIDFVARSTVRDHARESSTRTPETVQAPAVSLREYLDVTCAPFQVAVLENLLLPDSYRHHLFPRLTNRGTEELSPLFARPQQDVSNARHLPGAYFYLDSEFPGHYGHAMTEQMSRLWAWAEAKRVEPDLKALLGLRPGKTDISDFERRMFEAVGINRSDVVLFDAPVRVEKLLAATPMLSMPDYVHPDVGDTWGTVGAALEASVEEKEWPSRIFCSRRQQSRWCDNGRELEAVFTGHAFEIIYPEDFTFAEQAALFRHAEVVAGYAGSALFTLALCDAPKRVVMVSSEAYTATNEYLIAAVHGHVVDVLWCEPHEPRFSSGFTFDFDREGLRLKEVLAELDHEVGPGPLP